MDHRRVQRFGASIKAVRVALGMSQRALGERSGRSQVYVSLVERGRVPKLSIMEAESICQALGATLVLGIEAPVLVAGSRQRDAAHARRDAFVVRRLTRDGWIVRREVQIGTPGRPGWIDLLALHAEKRVLLVIEIKTELSDLGGLERQLGWYAREASHAARSLGWSAVDVLPVVLLLTTALNDVRLRENASGIGQAFPCRWRALMGVIRHDGSAAGRGWGIAMIYPRSRARDWLRPTVLDGRRSQAPHRHIADFLRAGR